MQSLDAFCTALAGIFLFFLLPPFPLRHYQGTELEMMDLKHATDLLGRYLNGDCTPEEKTLVESWYEVLDEKTEMPYNPEERKLFMADMKAKALAEIGEKSHDVPVPAPVVKIGNRMRTVWWAAAAILVILTSTVFFFNQNTGEQPETARNIIKEDVQAPISNRAMITLSNGKVVYLDSVPAGQVIKEGEVELVKLANGELQYKVAGTPGVTAKNTLFNPRGSKVISMVLADGSKVWLNAGSSLTYPVAFVKGERRVEITGEAYFDVAHNTAAPFIVRNNHAEVQVLGTEFNLNSNNEPAGTAVTLFRGSVKVSKEGASLVISPGQQAKVGTEISVLDNVDLESVAAWKDGLFSFNETSFDEMMQEIGRWYDVEIVYTNKVPERRFGGKMHRTANLSEVLQVLGESDVHYRLEGRQLIILK